MSAPKLYKFRVTLSIFETHKDNQSRVYQALTPTSLMVLAPTSDSAVEQAIASFHEKMKGWPDGDFARSISEPRIGSIHHISKHAEDYHPSWDSLPVREFNRRNGWGHYGPGQR